MRIVVLCGCERFLIEERTRAFAAILEERFGGIEQFRFDGETIEPAALLDELRSYGLMQRHKLVILDNAEVFLAGGKGADENDENDAGAKSSRRPLMERYAEHPVEDATLLMRATTWRKGKIDKPILARGAIIECDEPPPEKAVGWCASRCAKRYDCNVDPEAARLLVTRLGCSLQRLDNELQRLSSMAGRGGTITADLVRDQIAPSREEAAWEVQQAVASGDARVMLEKLHMLLTVSRHDPVPIAWAVTDLLRKQHAASHLLRRGVPESAAMRQARLFGSGAQEAIRAASRNSPQRLAQLLREAIRSDQHSKSGVGDSVRNLQALLVRIADVTSTSD